VLPAHCGQCFAMALTPTLAHNHCSWKGTITVYASPASSCVSLTYIHGPLEIQSKRSRILYHSDSFTDARELWPAHKMQEMTIYSATVISSIRNSQCIVGLCRVWLSIDRRRGFWCVMLLGEFMGSVEIREMV
jgi:hypothetical protein